MLFINKLPMEFRYEIEGGNFSRAGHASSAVKKILKQLNVDNRVIKRVVVALYEGEVNVVAHADKGSMLVDIDEQRIRIRIEDSGPGIPDIDLAMQAGFSTASAAVREMGFGAGMGLPNMKKNTDQMSVTSEVGKGTQVEMITWFSQ
jgi:anti-sigma regulatory factor (Ser/Thr protein kinase)